MKTQGITAKTHGNELRIQVNEVWVFLCTTDKGLGVPPALYDLHVRRERDGVFHLSWKLPPAGYDRIHVLRGTVPIADGIDGTNTTFGDVAPGEQPAYRVFGIKNGMYRENFVGQAFPLPNCWFVESAQIPLPSNGPCRVSGFRVFFDIVDSSKRLYSIGEGSHAPVSLCRRRRRSTSMARFIVTRMSHGVQLICVGIERISRPDRGRPARKNCGPV